MDPKDQMILNLLNENEFLRMENMQLKANQSQKPTSYSETQSPLNPDTSPSGRVTRENFLPPLQSPYKPGTSKSIANNVLGTTNTKMQMPENTRPEELTANLFKLESIPNKVISVKFSHNTEHNRFRDYY